MTSTVAIAMAAITNLAPIVDWDTAASSHYSVRSGSDVEFSDYALFIPTNAMTVTVSTNVVKGSNGVQMQRSQDGGFVTDGNGNYAPLQGWTLIPETERTETTIVTERRVLRLKWQGQWRELVSEKELSRTVKRWVKKEEWEEAR